MRLTELEVKNYGTFKHAKIDLDYKGITTIFGLNKDAASTQGGSYTNASGKSLLFSAIPEAGFGAPPSGKDQLKHNKSFIRLGFKGKTDVVVFDKHYGKAKKITITKNGRDVKNRTLEYGQAKIQQCLGVSEEEDFYTSRYIDNTIPHPLIAGSAANRQKFFVKLFDLENVDAIRHLLLAELREIQKASATYTELQDMFQVAKAKALSKNDIETKKKEEYQLKERQAQFLEQLNTYQVLRDVLSFEETNGKLLKRFHKLTSIKTFEGDYKKLKVKRKGLKADLESAGEWQEYMTLMRVFVDAADQAGSVLKQLGFSALTKEEIRDKVTKKKELETRLEVSKLELKRAGKVEKPDVVEDNGVDLVKAEKKVSRLEDEYEAAKNFKDGKCPTCGAAFKGRKHSHVKEDLEKARKVLKACKSYAAYGEARKAYKTYKNGKAVQQGEIELLEKSLAKYNGYDTALEALKKIPAKPAKPEGKQQDADALQSELDEVNSKVEQFKAFKDVFEQIEALENVTVADRKAVGKLAGLTDKMAEVSDKINRLTAEITSAVEARKQLKDIAGRGESLKAQVDDEPIVKALIDAYSKKGIKKLLIQRYAGVLQEQINKFTRMFFAEDIAFELRYGTKFEFLAHKTVIRKVKKGKKNKPSLVTLDVKRLSGAERRMLTLVLVVATLSMQPKNKRTNVLILDEPEANLGPEAVNTFAKAIVALTKVIPHIVVITPRPELNIEGSRVFTVVKRNGVSTLEQGRIEK